MLTDTVDFDLGGIGTAVHVTAFARFGLSSSRLGPRSWVLRGLL